MIGKFKGTMLIAAAVLLASAVSAQGEKKEPQMTPSRRPRWTPTRRPARPARPQGAGGDGRQLRPQDQELERAGWSALEEIGTATRKMALDGRVLIEEVYSTMMGTPFTGHGMTGFDNVTGKYWSTWTDSMSTGLMISEGTCDAQQNCTFTGSWNDPIKKGPVNSRMTSRWTSPTTEIFEMYGPGQGRQRNEDDGDHVHEDVRPHSNQHIASPASPSIAR